MHLQCKSIAIIKVNFCEQAIVADVSKPDISLVQSKNSKHRGFDDCILFKLVTLPELQASVIHRFGLETEH